MDSDFLARALGGELVSNIARRNATRPNPRVAAQQRTCQKENGCGIAPRRNRAPEKADEQSEWSVEQARYSEGRTELAMVNGCIRRRAVKFKKRSENGFESRSRVAEKLHRRNQKSGQLEDCSGAT